MATRVFLVIIRIELECSLGVFGVVFKIKIGVYRGNLPNKGFY